MQQSAQEFSFSYSVYITAEDEEGRKELAARPVDKKILIKLMSTLNLEGEWRITQTACGLIVSFMSEEDLLTFQEVDFSTSLGLEIQLSAISYSALDTYRQRMLIRDVPLPIPILEIQTALERQGICPLEVMRTRHGNIIVELGSPVYFNILLQDGFDFFSSSKFTAIPLPTVVPMASPAPVQYQPTRDPVLQCYRCQGFWHYAAQCNQSQRCVRCGGEHLVTDCPRPRNDPICIHCSGRHHAAYRYCPIRLQMKTLVPQTYLPMAGPGYLPPYFSG